MADIIKIHQWAGTLQAYLSVPPKATHYNGAVILCHEIWGLTDQVKRLADRFAEQGYYTLAPDLFSTEKVLRRPSEELQRRIFSPDSHVRYQALPEFRALVAPTQTPQFTSLVLSRLSACFEYVYNQPLVHQRVVIVGFGIGGDYTFDMVVREQRLRGAVVFYGHAPRVAAELRHIRCPILGLYGVKEQSLIREVGPLRERMAQAGVDFKAVGYESAGHSFFNDSNVFAYNQTAADDAWGRMMSFIHQNTGVVSL